MKFHLPKGDAKKLVCCELSNRKRGFKMPRGRPKRKSEEKIEAFVKKQTKNEFEQVEIFPNEIWLKIINYLSTMDIFQKFALVCKHFQALTLDGSAIKYLELKQLNN